MAQIPINKVIAEKIRRTKKKSLLFTSDFPQFGAEYVGDILSDYVKKGKLIRIANGVYLKTDITRFGPVYPSPTEIAAAIAKRDHAQVLMSGKAAENYFGLSTQVPMKIVFLTTGSARKLDVGNTTIEFKRGVPRNFAFRDTIMATLCLALKSIGNGHISEEQEAILKKFLADYTATHPVKEDINLMPLWMRMLIKKLMKENKPNDTLE